jgi:hypothetical protein
MKEDTQHREKVDTDMSGYGKIRMKKPCHKTFTGENVSG